MFPHRALGFGLLTVGLLASCADRPSEPQSGPAPIDHEIVHRDLDLLDPQDPGNIQIFDLDVTPEEPAIHHQKDGEVISSNRVLFRGIASLAPPTVSGEVVQITDMVVSGDGRIGLAVANLAGEAERGALQVLDLSTPLSPVLSAEVLLKDSEYNSVELVGRVAFAVGNDATGAILDVYDLRDLRTPRLAHRLALGARTALASCLDEDDDTLWVVTGSDGGLHTIDIDNPFAPVAREFLEVEDARHVARDKGRMFVLHGAGVLVLEHGHPRQIPLAGLPAQAPSRGVAFEGRYYVNTNEGIELVDPSHRDAERVYTDAQGTANGLATDDGRLFYRANGEGGLQVLQRSWRRGWYLDSLGTLDVANAGSSNSAACQGGVLFSGDGRGGILICSVDNRYLGD